MNKLADLRNFLQELQLACQKQAWLVVLITAMVESFSHVQQLGRHVFALRILFFLKTEDVISQQKGSLKGKATFRSAGATFLVSKALSTELSYSPKRGKVLWPGLAPLANLRESQSAGFVGWFAIHSPQPYCSWSSNGSCRSLGPDFHLSKMAITRPGQSRLVITLLKDKIPLEEGRKQYPRRWNNQVKNLTLHPWNPVSSPKPQTPVHCSWMGKLGKELATFPVPFLLGRTVRMWNWAMGYQKEFAKLMQRMRGATWPCSGCIRCIWWFTGLGQAVGWQRC